MHVHLKNKNFYWKLRNTWDSFNFINSKISNSQIFKCRKLNQRLMKFLETQIIDQKWSRKNPQGKTCSCERDFYFFRQTLNKLQQYLSSPNALVNVPVNPWMACWNFRIYSSRTTCQKNSPAKIMNTIYLEKHVVRSVLYGLYGFRTYVWTVWIRTAVRTE